MYLHKFCTVYELAKRKQLTSTKHNCFCRSHASENRPRNRTRSNLSRFRVTHVSIFHPRKLGAGLKLRVSSAAQLFFC